MGEIQLYPVITGLLGGLALFLFGMDQLAGGLKAAAGDRMKVILKRLTGNRFVSAGTGAVVTAVIQSSSVTTVLVVGFISAGLMTLTQSVGVIMGANIGTTITAQIIAFKVSAIALPLVAFGFGLVFFARPERVRQIGTILMGLGLVFFGMMVMSEAVHPLRSHEPVIAFMADLRNPLLGILVAAGFTALVQSSSATTGIVIVLASQGMITLPAGIAMIFGANIGTCITALLAAIGKPREAVRAAIVHVLFNVAGVILWFAFIPQLADLVRDISPVAAAGMTGAERLAAEVPRQIANAHTVFNVANTLIFIWFAGPIAWLAVRMVPDRPTPGKWRPKHLSPELLATPALALDAARREVVDLGARVEAMTEAALPALLTGDRRALADLARRDETVDHIHQAVVDYLRDIGRGQLSPHQGIELARLMAVANDLENIGDVIETDLVAVGQHRLAQNIAISPETSDLLGGVHRAVLAAVRDAVAAFADENPTAARGVIARKPEINALVDSVKGHMLARLMAEDPNRIATYTREVEAVEWLKRIYYFAKRLSRQVADPPAVPETVAETLGKAPAPLGTH